MGFYLKQYIKALRGHKKWALLALLPLLLYLAFAALTDITFTVSRDFSNYLGDTPVAASDSPTGTLRLSELVADPDLLYLDGFALTQLQKKLGLLENFDGAMDDNELRRLAHSTLSVSALGDAVVRLSYSGKDEALGRVLIAFYTDRLVKRIGDGINRAKSRFSPPPFAFQPTGDIGVVAKRSVWSSDRLVPATLIFAFSCLGVMLLIAVFELSDPSFKSERQVARYLGLPVLGAIPDAEPLTRHLPD